MAVNVSHENSNILLAAGKTADMVLSVHIDDVSDEIFKGDLVLSKFDDLGSAPGLYIKELTRYPQENENAG